MVWISGDINYISNSVSYVLADVIIFVYEIPFMLFQCWRSKLNHSQKIITKCDGIITNCDSLLYYKVRWTVVTNCDSFFITKCDKVYYKLRQVLQSAMNLLQIPIGITKCDDHYKLRQYICPKSLTAWITIISWLSCADLAWCSRLLLPGFLAIYYSESRAGLAVYLRNTSIEHNAVRIVYTGVMTQNSELVFLNIFLLIFQ